MEFFNQKLKTKKRENKGSNKIVFNIENSQKHSTHFFSFSNQNLMKRLNEKDVAFI
jgi:hypothetical protein